MHPSWWRTESGPNQTLGAIQNLGLEDFSLDFFCYTLFVQTKVCSVLVSSLKLGNPKTAAHVAVQTLNTVNPEKVFDIKCPLEHQQAYVSTLVSLQCD